MTHRLLVNPGTPQAWEIPLKSGPNRIGRGEHNDFQVPHTTVSGTHCEIVVSSAGAILKDLGSTNGTFVNRAPVHEAILQSGQHVQLGSVDMVFESATAAAGASATSAPPPPAPVVRMTGLRLSSASAPAAHPPVAALVAVEEEPPLPPPVAPPVGMVSAGPAFCKSHPKTPARFYCNKCRRYFCDLCVATLTTPGVSKKSCRACGAEVTPVHVHLARPTTKGFFAALPGAFIYPFRGFGSIILIFATLAFAALGFISAGLFAIFAKIAFYGFVFLFMQNIIHTTTADEKEPLGFPDAGNLFGAAFQLGVTILASFGLAIGLLVAKLFEVDIPIGLIFGATILGCLYFPMAFLAVAMKDSVLAANPLVVVPSILRMPVEYFVTTILLIGVFGMRQLGTIVASVAGSVSLTTKDMRTLFIALGAQACIAFINVYLLTVTMRILGLLYNHKKDKFDWFSH